MCRCCNSCEDVREAYRKKGWAFNDAESIEQCTREGWSEKIQAQKNEGCRAYGYLEVNKVSVAQTSHGLGFVSVSTSGEKRFGYYWRTVRSCSSNSTQFK